MTCKHRHSVKGADDSMWLTSYADLITAIVTVLVLMVSISKVDVEKYENAMQINSKVKGIQTLSEIEKKILELAREHHLEKLIKVRLQSDGLMISFDSAAQFAPSKYTLKDEKIKPLDPIFTIIKDAGQERQIDIIGHTDDLKNKDSRMTNWKLSALRAHELQSHLFSLGLPEEGVRIIAYAQTKPMIPYQGLHGEELTKARNANRRVSILIREAKPLNKGVK